MKQAPVLILVGASGVGKNTVAEVLLNAENSLFSYSRSLTTRDPRGTFADEYLYVTEEEFLSRVEAGKMLEHTRYGENYYGTPMSEVERANAEGKASLMILDINGVESIRKNHPNLPIYAVYLYAEPAEIRRRLEARDLGCASKENIEKVNKRLKNNRDDFCSLAEGRHRLFDAFVENNVAIDAAARVLSLYEMNASLSEETMLSMHDFFARAAKFEF